MRLCFIDLMPWDYDADTPYERPLGGMQSAACHLAAALAAAGHEVALATHTTRPARRRGVDCLSLDDPDGWNGFARPPGMPLVSLTAIPGPVRDLVAPGSASFGPVMPTTSLPFSACPIPRSTRRLGRSRPGQRVAARPLCRTLRPFQPEHRRTAQRHRSGIREPVPGQRIPGPRQAGRPAAAGLHLDAVPWAGTAGRHVPADPPPRPFADLLRHGNISHRPGGQPVQGALRAVPEHPRHRACRDPVPASLGGSAARRLEFSHTPAPSPKPAASRRWKLWPPDAPIVASDLGALAETTAGHALLVDPGEDWSSFGARYLTALDLVMASVLSPPGIDRLWIRCVSSMTRRLGTGGRANGLDFFKARIA